MSKKSSKLIIAKSLAQVVKKDTLTSWTEEEIRRCLTSETFVFHVIIHLLKTNFERNSEDYSWQASQSESKHSESSRSTESRMQFTKSYLRSTQKSSSRERSTQFVTREMQQSFIRSFHQSSIKHSLRESSIARNFLRQLSSSSCQSEVQEISEISENLYSDQSHSSENFYSRQFSSSEKKSTLRQSFQSRFSKFDQSSQLSKQFYKSSFVSSRLLSHEYSSSISSRSFVSSSSTSMIQSIRASDYNRELVNLTKLYTDEAKYSEKNDNFSFKLIMFNDMCDRVDVSFETKLKAFLTMLKELALNYYYANMTSKN
jgi:hypothetical protein